MCNTKTILREFNYQNDLYRDYGIAVKNLLENLLRNGNYKYQLSHRMKSRDSLKDKIRRKKNIGRIYKHLNEIDDVVGMRIVFYTEQDRKKFINSLNKALGVDLQVEETSKIFGYCSTHAIVTFGKERIALDEYKKFKGLKCEIQMTLILNHAWSEVEHDILYKEGLEMQGLDRKKYSALKLRMESIMQNYIQKASVGLESVVKNIKKTKVHK